LNIQLKKIPNESLLEDGDIVFVDASEDDEGASKHLVIINKNNIPFISGLHTIVAKSKFSNLSKYYLRYCFKTREIKKQFYFFAVGTKVTGISKTNIAKIILPVPSIKEQTQIAEILISIDDEIVALEEQLGKTKMIKEGMIQELLTGRIRLV
jgi:type I restriction enzyme S subunit